MNLIKYINKIIFKKGRRELESFRILLIFRNDDYRFYSLDEEINLFKNEITNNYLDGIFYDNVSDLLDNLEMYKSKHFIVDYRLETK